jgi:hypothetical protein
VRTDTWLPSACRRMWRYSATTRPSANSMRLTRIEVESTSVCWLCRTTPTCCAELEGPEKSCLLLYHEPWKVRGFLNSQATDQMWRHHCRGTIRLRTCGSGRMDLVEWKLRTTTWCNDVRILELTFAARVHLRRDEVMGVM